MAVATWRGSDTISAGNIGPAGRVWQPALAGFVLNLVNPKALLFFVLVAPRFAGSSSMTLMVGLMLVPISVSIATAIHLLIVVAADRAHGWLGDAGTVRQTRRMLAAAIGAVALWMMTS